MNFSFLFLGALFALPLAAVPVVLHLLFRKKSPVVLFSTTRFIQASMQKTAARRRLQKWLLLAARVLMVLLLIFIAAQPARQLAASLGGGTTVAAVVVDTSYSMMLNQEQQTLLNRANDTVINLLQNELNTATVSVYTSLPDPANEVFRTASERMSNWTPLAPQASPQPLRDRIAAAMRSLESQNAQTKWLFVLTDMQSREFPRSLDVWNDGNFVVFDLQPATARSAGITAIAMDPDQPIPGIGIDAVARVTGRTGDSRAVSAEVAAVDERIISTTSPRVVQVDSTGETEVRLPLKLPAEPFIVIRAKVDGDDDLPWDNTRQIAIQMPRQRRVKLLMDGTPTQAERFVTLALDPSEGRSDAWPLRVSSGKAIDDNDAAVVALLTNWPSIEQAQSLRDAADRGATIVLMLRPGLQDAWEKLPAAQREAIRPLLPGDPFVDPAANRTHRASPPAIAGTLLKELLDERFQLNAMTTSRLVSFSPSPQASILVAAAPTADGPTRGLVYRHTLGGGRVYTFATLPDPQFSTLATHPIFLPLIVRCCLPDGSMSAAQNVELGQSLKITWTADSKLTITTPTGEPFVIERAAGSREFRFDRAAAPGLYRWTNAAGATVGVSNVQLPAGEAILNYRDVPSVIPGERVMVAHTIEDFRTSLAGATQPSPRWSPLIACVLVLLCLEAMLGNSTRLWKLISRP